MENNTPVKEENALNTNHMGEAVAVAESETNTGLEQAYAELDALSPEELEARVSDALVSEETGSNLSLQELSSMTPEEVEKLVEQSMQENLGNSINQTAINSEYFGEVRYTEVYDLVKSKLNGIVADVTPENNRTLFFKNLNEVIATAVAFEENHIADNAHYTLEAIRKLFGLTCKHLALYLSLEAGGQGLRLHSDALFTNLIYDIHTNAEGVNVLLTNFGENVKELPNPEFRLTDMIIVNPVVVSSVIGATTLLLNKLIALELANLLPVDVEATTEDEIQAFIKIFNEL